MDILVTPGNGIMFLASFAFLAIGVVGWLSFKQPDLSAKLWMLGFMVSGIAPMLGALGGADIGLWPFISSSLALAVSFVLFGLALKVLYSPDLPLREYVVSAGGSFIVYLVCLGYSVNSGSERTQIVLFALGNGLAAAWATHQAVQLSQRSQSPFIIHLIIIFGVQTAFVFLRIPQALAANPTRLWEHDPFNEVILAILSICGIIKAVSYFGLRFEEVRERLIADTNIIREQATTLAIKNAEIVSAMHAVPIACVVTTPALKLLYLNSEARRLLGQFSTVDSDQKISDFMVGLRGCSQTSFAAARHMWVVTTNSSSVFAAEISANGLEADSSGAQWIFLIKPVDLSATVIESIWMGIPRTGARTWLICDNHGIVSSAQMAWGELLGAYAVFNTPELRFGGISEPCDAQGMNLWESLNRFSEEDEKINLARLGLRSGKVNSFLLRNKAGVQLLVGFYSIRSGAGDGAGWLVEVTSKRPSPSTVLGRARSQTTITSAKSPAALESEKETIAVPEFLRRN